MKGSVTELCGVEKPVFQAGMAGIAGPGLVAAVSNAGGLGHLGGLRQPPARLEESIRTVKNLTDKPFGVNLVPAYGGPDMFEAQLQVVFAEKPKILSLFYGDFTDTIPRARDAGLTVMVQVGSVAEARKAIGEGADIVIAQGIEADVRACLILGAQGVWVGTAFVATHESLAHDIYKRRLVEASTDDPKYRTGYSYGWKYGTPHRAIPPAGRPFNPLRLVGGGVRRVDKPSRAEGLSLYAGQGVGKITETLPAAEVVARLTKGFDDR
jgi:enoyl-[acyl-carrier protein] reductase II